MGADRIRSEQQEALEGDTSPGARESWGNEQSAQFTTPGGGGEPGDDEATEIAEEAGTHESIGPEHDAMRIEEGEEGSGRTGSPTSGYLDPPGRE